MSRKRFLAGMMLSLLLSGCGQLVASPTPAPPDTPASAPTEGFAEPMPATPNAVDTWIRPADGMVMVYVPAGEFMMGSTDDELDVALELCNEYRGDICERFWFEHEQPAHTVALDGFWLDRTEVTNGQYQQCAAAGACEPPEERAGYPNPSPYGFDVFDDYPVVWVDWYQATDYCAWAGKRLPTEAEWEYAARGGLAGKRYPWGDTLSGTDANYYDSGDPWDNDTSPVGYYAPNGYGLYDMAGNVFEWVNDRYQSDYYTVSPPNDPPGPGSGADRVFRGGAWNADLYLNWLRVANRFFGTPDYEHPAFGFRCAR